MKVRSLILLTFLISGFTILTLQGQTILSIDDQKISKQEFIDIYKKNNKDVESTKEDLDEYMELFINYKLKVMEAEKLDLHKDPDFIKELNGYESQLAQPYLIDNESTGALIDEAYERMKTEVNASHILINVKPKATPEDTLAAYNQLLDIRNRILKGEATFEEMAVKHSTDPSAKSNQGSLGYFKSLQMVYPFETAAYETKVGDISLPVKTRYGYHLVKVNDKRESLGEIKVAHILLSTNEKSTEKEKQDAKARIYEISEQLKTQDNFASLAVRYSDDKSSAKTNGELPRFGSGKMVKEFEENAFALKNDGDISKPFQSDYGWHIVKRLSYYPVPTKEEMYKELQQRISKDSRAIITRNSFYNKLKKDYNFKDNKKKLDPIYNLMDTMVFRGMWDPGKDIGLEDDLFTIGEDTKTQKDFINFLRITQARSTVVPLKDYVDTKYETYVNANLIDYEKAKLPSKYPKFKALMKEYRDGILLFNLTEEKIWGKASKDSTGLKNYYKSNMDDFTYEKRVKASIVQCKSMETAENVLAEMKKGKTSKEINDMFNEESKLNVIIKSGHYEKDDEEITKLVPFKEGLSEIKEINKQYVFLNISEVLEESVRPFEDSRGLVTAAYQKHLEEEWIKELRSAHAIEINRKVLHSVK